MKTESPARGVRSRAAGHIIFVLVVVAIIAAAIVRSNIATGLDSFTFDEGYHVGAGAAYVQTGDFRLNPEQPPLTKLWTGEYVTMFGYHVSPYRAFSDKSDERDFVEIDAYENNDPFVLQTRARTAMFALNGLLLLGFAFAVRRVFGDVTAIAATLFMAIDPTVAAHMPVVMTDLPIALTSGIAILLAARAFRSWAALDLVLAALGVGLALSAKHSGIIVLFAVVLIGVVVALFFSGEVNGSTRLKRVAAAAAVGLGGVIVLWAFYGFHFYESPGVAEETFNRPLADKISDVRSPYYRAGLNVMATGHLFPRAYTWGLADTIRAGAEGRAIPVLAFGQHYYAKAPFYYFPGIIAAKLPLGLLLLSLAGLTFLIINQLPRSFLMPFAIVVAFSAIFLIFLMRGSSYAGVRHAMPLFTVLALLGAFAVNVAVQSRSYLVGAGVSLLLVAAMVSALPQMRPWEYFNETAGGSDKAYLYFNDEGVDLSQRVGEMANFYHANLEPNGEVPFISYFSSAADRKVRGMDWVGHNRERDDRKYEGDTITGTVMIGANELGPKSWWDVGKPFRDRTPVARFGNMFVFQGTFEKPKAMISRSYCNRALYTKIYVAEPDIPGGIELLKKSLELDPSPFSTSLELGNLYLKLGNRDEALNAYKLSLEHAPETDSIRDLLADQVSRLQTDAIEKIAPLRNPGIE